MKLRGVIVGYGLLLAMAFGSCRDEESVKQQQQNTSTVASDADLFRLVTQTQPFAAYTLFPRADSVTTGTLNGSNAHQPRVRVSMNAAAFGALQNGRLPAGEKFPDGSVIFKQIRTTADSTIVYAIMHKEKTNSFAESQSGWLWAEYEPSGRVLFSISTRGSGCVGCHTREQGLQNDFVRTFERQRP